MFSLCDCFLSHVASTLRRSSQCALHGELHTVTCSLFGAPGELTFGPHQRFAQGGEQRTIIRVTGFLRLLEHKNQVALVIATPWPGGIFLVHCKKASSHVFLFFTPPH